MKPRHPTRRAGFTLVELLVAAALAGIVVLILAAAIRTLVVSNEVQTAKQEGPHAALRILMRELASAFLPPQKDIEPFQLQTSLDPMQPETLITFYAPVPEPRLPPPQNYDIAQITYAVQRLPAANTRDLLRITLPCAGPGTNSPQTNLLYRGDFQLQAYALQDNGDPAETWPPAPNATNLPPAVRLIWTAPHADPLTTDILLQAAHGIRSLRPDSPAF